MDKKNCLGLNKEYKADVEIGNYENLYVGLEFEFNILSGATVIESSVLSPCVNEVNELVYNRREVSERDTSKMKEIAEHFGITHGKTEGRGSKRKRVQLANGGSFEVPMDSDLYKEEKLVTQVYCDGSVDYEVVTRPVNLKGLREVKEEVFNWLKEKYKVDFWCEGKAGLHMTFLLDHHKERSKWNKTVVQNLIQYSRCYYEELIQLGRCNNMTRNIEYRKIVNMVGMEECSTSHHNCIACRKDHNGNIWGIEIRFPDSCDNWDKIMRTIKFWMALIRHCSIISKYGRITFDQSIWDKQKGFYESYHESNKIKAKNMVRVEQLAKQIRDSLIYYGVEIKDGVLGERVISKEDKLVEDIWELLLGGENYSTICVKMREKGFDQKQIYAACKEVGVK